MTEYHAKYFAHDLMRKAATGLDRLSMSLFDAAVDLNPHQIEAALFGLESRLSKGVILAIPFKEGYAFCVMGDAGGFNHETTRIKEHSFKDTGGLGWGSTSWDHWPIGWLNSQANEVTPQSLAIYPNHFSPAGMDLWGLKNEEAAGKSFYSLMGVSGPDLEQLRRVARTWLESGDAGVRDSQTAAKLPLVFP